MRRIEKEEGKMKKIIILATVFIMAFSIAQGFARDIEMEDDPEMDEVQNGGIQADRIDYGKSPLNKLGRGATNLVTCWAEIPATAIRVSQEKDPALGWTVGVAEGVFTALLRGATGLFDTVTCVIPPYDKPLMQPEYALNDLDKEQKEYLW